MCTHAPAALECHAVPVPTWPAPSERFRAVVANHGLPVVGNHGAERKLLPTTGRPPAAAKAALLTRALPTHTYYRNPAPDSQSKSRLVRWYVQIYSTKLTRDGSGVFPKNSDARGCPCCGHCCGHRTPCHSGVAATAAHAVHMRVHAWCARGPVCAGRSSPAPSAVEL